MQTLGTPLVDEFDILFESRVDSPKFVGEKTNGHARIPKTVGDLFVIVTICVDIQQEFEDGFSPRVDLNL